MAKISLDIRQISSEISLCAYTISKCLSFPHAKREGWLKRASLFVLSIRCYSSICKTEKCVNSICVTPGYYHYRKSAVDPRLSANTSAQSIINSIVPFTWSPLLKAVLSLKQPFCTVTERTTAQVGNLVMPPWFFH